MGMEKIPKGTGKIWMCAKNAADVTGLSGSINIYIYIYKPHVTMFVHADLRNATNFNEILRIYMVGSSVKDRIVFDQIYYT